MNAVTRELAKRTVEKRWQERRRQVPMRVEGTSMGETIPEGSTVLVLFSESPCLAKNKVVYIRRRDKRIVHRLLAFLGPICVEKGDGVRFPRLCLRRNIVGTVESFRAPGSNTEQRL